MRKKAKILLFFMLIIFILCSYFCSTIYLEMPKEDPKSDLDKEIEDFKDTLEKLRRASLVSSDFSIVQGMNLNDGMPYTFSAQFHNDADLEEAFTQSWLETKLIGDDVTNNHTLSVPNNYNDEVPEVPSNLSVYDGSISTIGDLTTQDGDETWINSSECYHYPGTHTFTSEQGESGLDINFIDDYGVSGSSYATIIDYWYKHRNV
ncbi:MAG: hypothetical protein ACFE96_14525, partial [Candidatus Hermodarchaeota archaeon]